MIPSTQAKTHPRLLPRLALSLGVVATLTAASPTPNSSKKEDEQKPRGAFPTLKHLPEGSILRRVRLPRYDKEFNPISLLQADQLLVLDQGRIQAEDVSIELYAANGSVQASTKMRSAIYDQENSILRAKEAVYIKGNTYVASGAGLIFHWDSRMGFLHGPASTRFYIEKNSKPNMNSTSSLKPKLMAPVLAGSLMLASSSLMAEPPAPLTQAQLDELTELAKPTAQKTRQLQSDTKKAIETEDDLSKKASEQMRPFLKSIGKETLLIQAPTAAPETAAPDQATANSPKKTSTPAPPAAKPNQTTLLVECDGGLYFDSDTGMLAYLKNVRLTEERFNLTCSDELKVFLEKKEPAKKEPTKKGADKTEKKEDSMASFGELNKIVARGKVKLTRKDDQGRVFIASGETASYNAKTGEMILRGGMPRLQQSKNQYLQAQEPGQWIRVQKNGKLVTSKGKWKMLVVRNQAAP